MTRLVRGDIARFKGTSAFTLQVTEVFSLDHLRMMDPPITGNSNQMPQSSKPT